MCGVWGLWVSPAEGERRVSVMGRVSKVVAVLAAVGMLFSGGA